MKMESNVALNHFRFSKAHEHYLEGLKWLDCLVIRKYSLSQSRLSSFAI